MIAVHQNVNMFIRRAMKCSEGSIWSGFAVSDYDIQICGGGTVCPNATYRQFKAAIGDPIYNGRFCLRFVAAVSVSCSGDKSDKEESAGGVRCYGDCGLRLL